MGFNWGFKGLKAYKIGYVPGQQYLPVPSCVLLNWKIKHHMPACIFVGMYSMCI